MPKEAEFKVRNLLDMVKDDKEVQAYLPQYSKTQRPNKEWLCNVLNTVYNNSVTNMIKKIKEQKLEHK